MSLTVIQEEILYKFILDKIGINRQLDITIEELSELIHAILKARRNGGIITYNLLEELSHVKICINVLEFYLKRLPYTNISYYNHFNNIYRKRLTDWYNDEKSRGMRDEN